MTGYHREFLLDLFTGVERVDNIPESLAGDQEAIDWLFYRLHEFECPAAGLIDFLGKHHSDDRRFKLWKDRAFHPGLGEDGMESETAYRYIERSDPAHPLLDPFMRQAAYSFTCDIDFVYLGKDFQSHLRSRYSKLIGDSQSISDVSRNIDALETMEVERIAEDTFATFENRLAALGELAQRESFDCFFRTDLPYEFKMAILQGAKKRGVSALRSAARKALLERKHPVLAFDVLLAQEIGASEFLELLQFARQIDWHARLPFLGKIMDPGCNYPEDTIRRSLMDITREDKYCRGAAIPFLLGKFPDDNEVIELIKSCAESESDDYRFSQILTQMLDHGIGREWVRSSALAFLESHGAIASTLHVLGRIGDIDCTRPILDAFESPIQSERHAAIRTAGEHHHYNPSIRAALLEQARSGHVEACKWIIRQYPDDSRTAEILESHLNDPKPYGFFELIPLMCLQGIMVAKFREQLMIWVRNPTQHDGSHCTAVLAIRAVRNLLFDEISVRWENLIFQHPLYLTWYPVKPMIARILERLRAGDFMKNPRKIVLHISRDADVAEALREGIIAAAPHEELSDAILVLGLIYGERPETRKFLKDYVKLDPSQRKYGSEVAFAEALRLGKRDMEDFEWAVEAMGASSERKHGGLANHGPRLLAHFFGLTTEVLSALEMFSHSATNPILADSSRGFLKEKFPGHLPDLSREAISLMPVDRRINHLRQLAKARPPQITELQHFALHDPVAEVRKEVLVQLQSLISRKQAPEGWDIGGFAMECLKDAELAGIAANILAQTRAQDVQTAIELLSAHARFPDAGIVVPLAEAFGEIPAVRSAVCKFITICRDATPSPNPTPHCTCMGCIGFDKELYAEVMVLLHSPPFRGDDESTFLRKDMFKDPRIEPGWRMLRILNAEIQALEQSERSAYLERIARSDALPPFRQTACECLAKLAETEDEPLESLLAMMREDDMELKNLAKKSCGSIALNSRRNHRALQALLKS
jgi:hypothetical protein